MNNEYFELVKPTYIENWPSKIMSLSIPSIDIPLTINDAYRLGSNIKELYECFDTRPHQNIKDIVMTIHKEIIKFPNGGFIRLGSRSAKDAFYGKDFSSPLFTGEEAINQLLGASERIMEDLLLAINNNYKPYIFIREWIDIPKWSEFRCFVKDEKLIGISQYDYFSSYFEEINKYKEHIKWSILYYFNRFFINASHLNNVIFDIFIKIKDKEVNNEIFSTIKLIEINPFFEMTDPCLFDWREEFDNSFRYNNNEGKIIIEEL